MPNRTIPEFFLHDVTLNRLPLRPWAVFYRLHHVVDDYGRFPVGTSPTEPDVLRSRIFGLCPKISVADLAHDLQRLIDARLILLRDSDRGWYGEIADHMKYRKEDYSERVPRYGPRAKPAMPNEPEPLLKLGPMGALPSAAMKTPKLKPIDSDSVHDHDHDSPRSAMPASQEESRNRDLSMGEEEKAKGEGRKANESSVMDHDPRFARTEAQICALPLGRRLWTFIGPKQMRVEAVQSGAQWMKLIAERGDELGDLLDNGERIQSAELQTGEARAKWLTRRLKDRAA